jgi:Carboxypeptidase regulatory-like domain
MTKGIAIIAFLAVLQAASAQQPAKASIEGAVLRAGTDEPLATVHVTLTRDSQGPVTTSSVPLDTTTDSLGHYAIQGIDPGAYRLTFTSNGFVKQEYGQKVFPGAGAVLSLGGGESLKNIVAHLSPAGNVGGHIRDARGNPAIDVVVQLFRYAYRVNGTRGLQFLGGTKSDDRGEYRFYWLTPDTYYIYAGGPVSGPGSVDIGSLLRGPSTNRVTETYRAAFYRNAVDLRDAMPVRVQPGDDLGGMDFTMSPQTAFAIHGRVTDSSAGQFPAAAEITVLTQGVDEKFNTFSARSYYNATNGTFDIPNLSPGSYTIRATVNPTATTQPSSGSATITVGATDVTGVLIQIQSSLSLSISGHATVDNATTTNAAFELRSIAGVTDRTLGTTSRDGTLKFDNVPPGDYWLVCITPTLFIQTAMYGTEDVLNRPIHFTGAETATLNIALSSKGAEVRGIAHDGSARPSTGGVAVLVPNRLRERADLYKNTTTDQNGGFTFTNVPPGDYTIFVWEVIEQYAWFDQSLLSRLEAISGNGKVIRVSESSGETLTVRTIGAGEPR